MNILKIGKAGCMAALLCLTTMSLVKPSSIHERMNTELDVIKHTFEVQYAPAEWKKQYAGWDLDVEIEKAKQKINAKEDISIKEFQQIVKEFFNTTRDYHVGVHFYSTEIGVLPFQIKSAEGRYFVVHVEDPFITQLVFNTQWDLAKHDEIVTYNGKPIAEAVQEFKSSALGNPESATDQGLAEFFFTQRMGAAGHTVPQGKVTIGVRHKGSDAIVEYTTQWLYFSEELQELKNPRAIPQKRNSPFESPIYRKEMVAHFLDYTLKAQNQIDKKFKAAVKASEIEEGEDDDFFDENPETIGARNSTLPELGPIIWRAPDDSLYQAYIYKSPNNKNIGFIRIPHYEVFSSGGTEAQEFGRILNVFERKADALIIDQQNNPGGNMFYMYGLCSMLTNKPFIVPKERMSITQEEIFDSLSQLDDLQDALDLLDYQGLADDSEVVNLFGFVLTKKDVRNLRVYYQDLIMQWNSGKNFTDPMYLMGVSHIDPNKQFNFTKPILILVNHLDFSCGDFFPAMMQDNKRAKVMGSNTAGAGGFVFGHSHPNLLGIQGFSYTASIAERLNKDPIENLGVTPDIFYEVTPSDLQNGYQDQARAINQEVDKLVQ